MMSDPSDLLNTDPSIDLSRGSVSYEDVDSHIYAVPDVTCFPNSLTFSDAYPNCIVHQKVLITNSGHSREFMALEIVGDESFVTKQENISLDSESTTSVIVSFHPTIPKLCTGELVIKGRVTNTVRLTGRCLEPPIYVTSQDDDVWKVSGKSTIHISVFNRHISRKHTVQLATNNSAFTLKETNIEIDPASFKDVSIY